MIKWQGWDTQKVWHKSLTSDSMDKLFLELENPENDVIRFEDLENYFLADDSNIAPDIKALKKAMELLSFDDFDEEADQLAELEQEVIYAQINKLTDQQLKELIESSNSQAYYQEFEEI